MPDFLPPETQEGEQKDLLEQLLVVAAEKAAKQEADQALKKGFVTREQINQALATFGEQLSTDLEDRIVEKITQALMPQVEQSVKKAAEGAGIRKGTIVTPEDERDADPVGYLLKKGKELGPEAYDDTDKRIIWGLTHKVLTQGMSMFEDDDE